MPTEKNRWTPPDCTVLKLKIRKKMKEKKKAKYFQLRILKKYRSGTAIEFADEPSLNRTFQAKEEYKNWLIVKLYLPIDSEVKSFKDLMQRQREGTTYDRLAIKLPKSFTMEIDAPHLFPAKVRDMLVKHISKAPRKVLPSVYYPKTKDGIEDKNNAFYLLTNKNWDIVEGEPKKENSFTIKTKDLKEAWEF